MIRLSINKPLSIDATVTVDNSDWHYLIGVMRRQTGDNIEVLTSDCKVFEAILTEKQTLRCTRLVHDAMPPSRHITLYQALLKGDHFSAVVDKGTQAGITRFVPIITERCIVREANEKKLTRWRTIAKEASEQSRRTEVPVIEEPRLIATIQVPTGEEGFLLDPNASYERRWLEGRGGPVHLAVGPEGGFSPQECMMLQQEGLQSLSLGKRVYRAENAGVFAAILFLQ